MNPRFMLLTAGKELRLRMRDPGALAVWLGVTVALAVLMTVLFGGRGAQSRLHGRLLVADEDGTLGSMLVAGAFSQGPLGEIFTVEKMSAEQARSILDDGDASGLLIIPKGFGAAVLRDEPTRLELVTNPAQRILPKMLHETLDLLSEASFYLQTVGRGPLRRIAEQIDANGQPPDATVAEISVAISQTVGDLAKHLDPPLIQLAAAAPAEEAAARPNMGTLFFPSMLFMTLLFMAQGLSGEIWAEREQGTLRRVASTPAGLAGFAAGRTLAFSVLLAAIATVAISAGSLLIGMDAARPILAILWITVSACVMHLLMTWMQTFATSGRTGGLVTSILVFPLAMLGGAFFPLEVMPQGMAAVGRLTPNGWALELFKGLLSGEAAPATIAAAFAAAAALTAILVPLLVVRLRSRFVQG